MSIRHWFRQRVAGDDGSDVPPSRALFSSLVSGEQPSARSLGEYDSASYPKDLSELLARRQQVAMEVVALDITDPAARVEAIPRLRELLRVYPHPLVYETLVHAYADAGRYDEAKGVAFAARERRTECLRSPHPEIRAEVAHLHEWTTADVEALRAERER
jgi:hypothetical protein